MKTFVALCFISMLLLPQPSIAQQTVFLIRHAEKIISIDKDPPLSEKGTQRANALVELFSNAKPSAIFTTQYQRTQLTAKPLSEAIDVPITVLETNTANAAQYPALLLQKICALPKNATVLVVGHSNSIPAIVQAWSHKPMKAIDDNEYNRFFMITLEKCQVASSLDLRYE